MAEALAGLAIASSIIAVIQVAGSVVKTGWTCYRAMKSPHEELSDLMTELMSLQGVLSTLHDHVSNLHHDNDIRKLAALEVLNQPDGVLATCTKVLKEVSEILEGLQKRKLASLIAVATQRQKLVSAKSRIERLKLLLTLAISSDHL